MIWRRIVEAVGSIFHGLDVTAAAFARAEIWISVVGGLRLLLGLALVVTLSWLLAFGTGEPGAFLVAVGGTLFAVWLPGYRWRRYNAPMQRVQPPVNLTTPTVLPPGVREYIPNQLLLLQ